MEHFAPEQASAIADGTRLYHLIAEGIPNMVWTAGPDGALDYFNARVFEYTGLSESELRGWGWQDAIHPDDRKRCEVRWKQSLADGEPYWIEYRIRRGSDKTHRWHIGAALPLCNPDGSIAKWFGTCTDIEDQKRAAEMLRQRQDSLEELAADRLRAVRETDDRYRALVEMSGDAIIVRQDDRFVYVNPAAVRLYGFQRAEELLGKVMGDFAHPEDLPKIRERAVHLAQSDEPLPIEEFRLRRPDGTYAMVEVLAAPFVFEGRRAVQVIMRDLSDRRRSEQALRERERQLSEAQRLAQLGSWSWDPATGQAMWSDEMFRIFGLDSGSGAPAPDRYSSLYTAESWQRLLEVSARSLETGTGYELELEAVRPDGTKRWTRSRAECMFVAGSMTGLRGTVQDITERRAAQHELQQYSDRVKQLLHRLVDAQEVERRNLASALHDLIGQNLTALNIGLDILKKDLHASAGARVGKRLESLASTVEKTIDAIRDVMAELHPAVLDDYGLVPALHAQAQRFSELTGLRTRVDAFDDHPRLERKVELALYRIVQEALANAMKHSGASMVVVAIAREGSRARLTVQDDGVGFGDPVGARSSRRGGWGLSAMRERAEAVGALLKIQFPEEGGTRVLVKVDLPDAD
jgi:PAS domain S-box-containing protein